MTDLLVHTGMGLCRDTLCLNCGCCANHNDPDCHCPERGCCGSVNP